MSQQKWLPRQETLTVALVLALVGMACGGDELERCEPKVCCPVEQTKKVTKVIHSEKVTEVCFPPSPFAQLKKWLGLGQPAGGGCDSCCGQPRCVHKLFKKIETEEKVGLRFEPVICPKAPAE